ncbi:60S ribosomal L27-3-like [Olea europaea subsp. europaea]|uniref:60S ribosomal L27-3-like n=1 Tax=Olea europaea subsp. europaea TaxID=158383 RepID=A0A8S0SK73_OLEEU|nr:60S ribosomal L27-3-like [Olea europaea subsp. europaea]
MVKFLKQNKAVVLLQGRFAGHKATIVKNFDDGTRDRPYGHCLVAGIAKYPSKVIRKDSAKKQAKKSRVKAFVKVVNYNHIMPTRYTLDVDLKDIVAAESLFSRDKKVQDWQESMISDHWNSLCLFLRSIFPPSNWSGISQFCAGISARACLPWIDPPPPPTPTTRACLPWIDPTPTTTAAPAPTPIPVVTCKRKVNAVFGSTTLIKKQQQQFYLLFYMENYLC